MAPKGSHYEPHPLDFALLERMPAEGTTLGFHVIAATVSGLRDDLNRDAPAEGRLTSEQIAGRLTSMKVAGYAVTVKLLGNRDRGWQRTKKGELHYSEQTGNTLATSQLRAVNGGNA